MLRRPLALAAALALTTTLAACSGGSGSSPAASGSAGSGRAIKVVYVPGLTGNPFYNTVACGARTEAAKRGVTFSVQGDPTFDVQKQTAIVNALIAAKPDAIMISITDPKAMIPPLTRAKAAGIEIVAIDGDVADSSIAVTNIQSDGTAGGELAGEALAKAVGGKGEVLALDNATGSTVSKARTDGFAAAIAKHPGMKFLGVQYTNNDVSKAASIVAAAATTNEDLVGVLSAETNNTEGAITGVRQAGRTGDVKIAGYDTSDPIVAALKAGTIVGTVAQSPRDEGRLGVDAAVAAVNGEKVQRDQTVSQVFATPENYTDSDVASHIYDVNCKG